jgi:hypothetical protein
MRGVRGLLVFLGCVLPGVAWSADVRLSLGVSTEYDNNVFRAPEDEKSDVVFRITPHVRVVEDREKLTYDVGYMLPYEIGVKYSEVRDLNHLVGASFNYRLTPQTEVFGNNAFYYVRGLYGRDSDIQDPVLGGVGDNRERVLSNILLLGTRHYFTPRLTGTLAVNQGVYDTTQFNRANALSFGGTASSAYQLTERHQVGGGLSYARQSFDDTVNRPSSDTDYYNLFGSWMWMFDETTRFDVRAGPALIHSNQEAPPSTVDLTAIPFNLNPDGSATLFNVADPNLPCPTLEGVTVLFDNAGRTCPANITIPASNTAAIDFLTDPQQNRLQADYLAPFLPESVSDTRITYFANIGISKRWTPNLISSLSYVRQDDTASGIDGGATLDAVTLSSAWRIADRWDLSARADWTLRESATNGSRVFVVPCAVSDPACGTSVSGLPAGTAGVDNVIQLDSPDSLDTQRWGTAIRLAYLLTRNTTTALQYTFNRQSSKGDTVGNTSDFDDHLVTFTVQYNFEPIGLWW